MQHVMADGRCTATQKVANLTAEIARLKGQEMEALSLRNEKEQLKAEIERLKKKPWVLDKNMFYDAGNSSLGGWLHGLHSEHNNASSPPRSRNSRSPLYVWCVCVCVCVYVCVYINNMGSTPAVVLLQLRVGWETAKERGAALQEEPRWRQLGEGYASVSRALLPIH
jgi:hypothetical protein